MNAKIAKLAMLVAVSTATGFMLNGVNARADTTVSSQSTIQQTNDTSNVDSYTQNNIQLFSNNLAQTQTQAANAAVSSAQSINIPDGYTLDAVRNVQNQTQANELEKIAINGVYNNNYQQDKNAAQEAVDINNLTSEQTVQMNQYALNLVNQVRYKFNEQPFIQNQNSIDTVKNLASEYQSKNESLLNGHWHDENILQGHAENISAFQIYINNVSGLRARPFDEARGSDFSNTNSVPLFSVSNMDDLQAMIYYGVTLMLFKDADDLFGHAQNFLTNYQPINLLSVYPSLTEGTGTGKYSNGTTFTYKLQNVDMHFIWAGTNQASANQPSDTNVTGWRISQDGNHYVYYENNQPLQGRHYAELPTINGTGTSWYLVNNGVVQSGIQEWAGSYYYFDPSTYLRDDNKWVSAWGYKYYFGNDGRAVTGVQKINGTYYYFTPGTFYLANKKNYAQSQWGDWYLVGDNGQLLTGVQQWAGSYYYFDPSTYLKVTNDYRQSQWGSWYLFGNDGRILTGVQKWAGSYYYFDPVTYLRVDNNYVRSQWGDWYMFGSDGRIVTGLYKWMGSLYYFDPVTYLKATNRYVYANGVRYWANANGQLSLA